jgi:STE24 endopeptidase
MPLLLILLTVAACLPTSRFAPPAGVSRLDTLLLTLVTMAVPVLVTALGCRAVARQAVADRPAAARRYNKLRPRTALLTLAGAVASVVFWGWSDAVARTVVVQYHGRWLLAPFAELLMPLPYYVALLCNWVAHHDAERALHRTGPDAADGYWSRGGFVGFQARHVVLFVGLPIGFYAANQTFARFFAETAASPWAQAAALAAVLFAFATFPRVVPAVLGLVPLPAGPQRDRLAGTAARLGVRFTRLLLWPTRGTGMNAMVLGLIPQARYVIFTDRILTTLTPAELDAVLGHECGHVRRGHLWLYPAFLVLSSVLLAAGGALAEDSVGAGWVTGGYGWAAGVAPLAGMGVWLFLVFGWLSRACEREADVFGARAGSCLDPHCAGHADDTILAPRGRALCRTGALAMVAALDRVGEASGSDRPKRLPLRRRAQAWFRAWQHGPMSHRIAFLLRLADDPSLGDRADRAAFRAKAGLLALLAAAAAATSAFLDWSDLLAGP